MVIFSYTGSPGKKIRQKVLGGGATFLTHTVYSDTVTYPFCMYCLSNTHCILRRNFFVELMMMTAFHKTLFKGNTFHCL